MSLEQIQDSLNKITGALNAQIELSKKLERRLDKLENTKAAESTKTDLTIPKTEEDLKGISRLPDAVKELQTFDGNPTQYLSWVHSVENILQDYEVMRNKPIYRAILQHIRQKIRGNADSALISYNIFNEEWTSIKKCLSLHYADKRDMGTLEHQMSTLSQRHMSIDEFYASVNHQFSLIVNKIKTEDYSMETVNVLVEMYRNRALDVFIRGLNGDLMKMLIIKKPATLPEAYATCLEMQNMSFRNLSIHKRNTNNWVTAPINQISNAPPVPKNNNTLSIQRRNLAYNIQHQSHNNPYSNQNSTSFQPPRPNYPKPQIPMEVDPSIQSRRVNYINRPIQQETTTKREHSHMNEPRKQQRVNLLETQEEKNYYNQMVDDNVEDEEIFSEEQDTEEDQELNFMTGASLAYHT